MGFSVNCHDDGGHHGRGCRWCCCSLGSLDLGEKTGRSIAIVLPIDNAGGGMDNACCCMLRCTCLVPIHHCFLTRLIQKDLLPKLAPPCVCPNTYGFNTAFNPRNLKQNHLILPTADLFSRATLSTPCHCEVIVFPLRLTRHRPGM